MSFKADHVVIIGGSVAGMMTARGLSEHFAQVTMIERDSLEEAGERRGVPQGHQLHGVMMAGSMAMNEIYGDFTETMRAAGCAYFDMVGQALILDVDGWSARATSGMMSVSATRWTIERVIRELTLPVGNVQLLHGQVTGLLADSGNRRVTGVQYRSADGGDQVLEADLVIDASGRGSRSPKWIEGLGYTPPEESVVTPYLGYACVHCHLDEEDWPGDIRLISALPTYGYGTRGGVVKAEENGLVGFAAAGHGKDYPPGDPEGFTAFLKSGISPLPYEMWLRAEPVTDIRTTRTSTNRLTRWHAMTRRPERFLAIADAIAGFNPVYGAGMSVAGRQAVRLRDLVAEVELDEVVERFPGEAAALGRFAWTSATGADLEWPTTEAVNMYPEDVEPPGDAAFFRKLRRLAIDDGEVAVAVGRAMTLMEPGQVDNEAMRERVRQAPDLEVGPTDITLPPDIVEALGRRAPATP